MFAKVIYRSYNLLGSKQTVTNRGIFTLFNSSLEGAGVPVKNWFVVTPLVGNVTLYQFFVLYLNSVKIGL